MLSWNWVRNAKWFTHGKTVAMLDKFIDTLSENEIDGEIDWTL